MNERLNSNLNVKIPLIFRSDGSFRLLMLSDIQETLSYDKRTLIGIEGMINSCQPDLVVLGGDNCDGTKMKTKEELSEYLAVFSAPMESRGIPWAHVFGNHDHDYPVPDEEMQAIYESFPHCVSKHTSGIGGITNFVLPVKAHDTERIALNVWGLDSNNKGSDIAGMHGNNSFCAYPDVRPAVAQMWDIVRFPQLMWFWESSEEIGNYNGGKPEGIIILHIAPHEIQLIKDNMEQLSGKGETCEHMGLGVFNSGLFSMVFQSGDVHTIASGHSHKNTVEGEYCGIRLCLDGAAGYSPYGLPENRGGRLFVFHEDGTSDTQMLHSSDWLTASPTQR